MNARVVAAWLARRTMRNDTDSLFRGRPVDAYVRVETSDKIVHLPLTGPHSRLLTIS